MNLPRGLSIDEIIARERDNRTTHEQARDQYRANARAALQAAEDHRAWLENSQTSASNKRMAIAIQDGIIREARRAVQECGA